MDLDTRFPGIKQHVVFHEMGTARTMNEYLNTPGGATYGFAQTTPFMKGKPPSSKTSVPGLYVASAFGSHGGGFVGAMLSGSNAARQASRWAQHHGRLFNGKHHAPRGNGQLSPRFNRWPKAPYTLCSYSLFMQAVSAHFKTRYCGHPLSRGTLAHHNNH